MKPKATQIIGEKLYKILRRDVLLFALLWLSMGERNV
jgi:hypothetical protein